MKTSNLYCFLAISFLSTYSLFDHTIPPLLTYSCKILGAYAVMKSFNKYIAFFSATFLKLRKYTPLPKPMGQLGRYQIEIIIKS